MAVTSFGMLRTAKRHLDAGGWNTVCRYSWAMAKIANRPSGGVPRFEGDTSDEQYLVCDGCGLAVNQSGSVGYRYAEPADAPVDFGVFHKQCDPGGVSDDFPRSIELQDFIAVLARRHLNRSTLLELAREALDPS